MQVGHECFCERMGAERGNHVLESGDTIGEQIDDGLMPRKRSFKTTKDIL